MCDFKAEMYQIRFPLGLCPRAHWGSLQRSRPLTTFRGPTSKGEGGKEKRKGNGREWERR